MQNQKRRLAALLAAVMLISTLPVNALAAAPDTGEESSLVGQTYIRDKPDGLDEDDMEASDSEAGPADEAVPGDEVFPADEAALELQIPENAAADDSNGKVTILLSGGEQQLAELSADGSYVIDLGNDPFFPYEAAVLSEDGRVYPITFEDADNRISVGEYVFTAAYTGTAQKIGFWAGDIYIPAYPETAAAYSLLPLKYKNFYVDMRDLVGTELQNVKLDAILTNPNKPEEGSGYNGEVSVVWGVSDYTDRFTIAQKDTIDLSSYLGRSSVMLELIVGTPDQLDPNNVRYIVTVQLSDPQDMIALAITAGDESQTQPDYSYVYSEDGSYVPYYHFSQYPGISFWNKDDVALTISYGENVPAGLDAEVYLGRYENEAAALAAGAERVTEAIWGSNAPGYKNIAFCSASNERSPSVDADTMPCFTVVYKRDGKEVYDLSFGVFVNSTSPFNVLDFALREGDSAITTSKFYANSNRYSGSEDDSSTDWIYSASIAKEDMERLADAAVLMRFAENNRDTEGVTVKVFDGRKDITGSIWESGMAEGIAYDFQSEELPRQIRAVLTKDEKTVTLDFGLRVYQAGIRLYYYGSSIYAQEDNVRNNISNGYSSKDNIYTQKLDPGYPATGTYYLNLELYNGDPGVKEPWANNGIASVKRAVLGSYTTVKAVQAQPDIKDKLFESATSRTDTGYAADFSKGAVTFTVLDIKNDLHRLTIQLEETDKPQTPLSANNALYVYGVKDYSSYVLQSSDDSYYSRGYQTLFVLDDEGNPVTAEKITPIFNSHEQARIYLGLNKTSGILQVSGESPIPFESGAIRQYSAASEDEKHLANYFVTFLTPQEGKKLFVNAVSNSEHRDSDNIPLREVRMNSNTSYHDILIANIGEETLGSLSVEMDESPLIHLDEYWTIQDGTRQLAPFTTVRSGIHSDEDGTVYRGELPNIAKIRLLPTLDEESGHPQTGVVDTFMTIASDGGTEKIHLTGLSGKLSIVTDTIVPGVKYVPYSSVIQTNALRGSGSVVFDLDGELPAGVTLRPTGEIYGVPLYAGTFKFTVRAYFAGYEKDAVEQEYELVIEENTDDNVYNATDTDYTITDFVGNRVGTENSFVVESIQDDIFLSLGEYSTFVAFYVDGVKQVEGEDYTSEEGSTKITVYAKTLEKTNDQKSHTLAAEFREGGDKENGILKRAAHNYKVDIKSNGTDNDGNTNNNTNNNNNSNNNKNENSTSGSNTSNSPGTSSSNSGTPSGGNTDSNTVQLLPTPFLDVAASDWFVEEVLWVLEHGYMIGESPTSFAPNRPIQQTTLVQVLARMAGVDLTAFENEQDDTIADKWYKPAAIWAKRSGALPDGTQFQGEVTINRDQMSIMLTKHLRTLGIDTTAPANRVAFADETQMSQAGSDAFQFLYSAGIFKGVGDMQMDPGGLTTRAQFAALIHRVTDYAKSQNG